MRVDYRTGISRACRFRLGNVDHACQRICGAEDVHLSFGEMELGLFISRSETDITALKPVEFTA